VNEKGCTKIVCWLVFLVNEKCNLITQVWQNLALDSGLSSKNTLAADGCRAGTKGERKLPTLTALALPRPGVNRIP